MFFKKEETLSISGNRVASFIPTKSNSFKISSLSLHTTTNFLLLSLALFFSFSLSLFYFFNPKRINIPSCLIILASSLFAIKNIFFNKSFFSSKLTNYKHSETNYSLIIWRNLSKILLSILIRSFGFFISMSNKKINTDMLNYSNLPSAIIFFLLNT